MCVCVCVHKHGLTILPYSMLSDLLLAMGEALRGPFGETPPPPGPPLGPHFGPPLGPPIGPPLGPPLGPLEACREYNSNHSLHTADYELAETPKVIAGALTFFVVLPFVLFHFPFFPIGPTAIVLTGACLMVITGVITQDEAYEVLGQKENLTTLFLLLGMMLLAQFFERELIINKFLCKVLRKDTTFEKYVLWICLMTFPLAALFTNDVTCVIITPMILKVWKKQKRARVELDIVLLAIATSADIGSVTTTFGNPQMALIAAKTIPPVYHQSRLDLHRCMVFLLFPAVIGLGVNYVLLVAFYRWRSNRLGNKNNMDADENITIETPNIPHDKLPGKIGELPEIVIPSPSKNHPDEVGGKRDDETNSIFLTRQEENENRIQHGSFCISGQTMGALHRAPKTSSETLPHSEKGSCPLADSAAQMVDMSKVSANLAGCQTGSDAFLSEFTPKSKNNLGTPCKTKDMHHFAPSDSSLFRTILFCLLVMAMFGFFFSGNLIHVNMGKKIFLSSLSYLFTLQPAVLTYIFTF